ncbi:tetrahydromethanopterin-linked C1 transfer pathway [Rhodopirellula sp. JC740]|uniref:Tetrahydromethanopterin-linked C1 transfer pathway n=1 Tax=Rhodopirellula halodulae TaxID=2894198 RepID=A0ABS8NDQ5_9BACT|nr:tetrahydromethanopterin-linked C1 transfer pathway [Rhodopirellula sp. JC740]
MNEGGVAIDRQPRTAPSQVLGVDVGGANLKSVLIGEESTPILSCDSFFPMWRQPDQLADQLKADWETLLGRRTCGSVDAVAVTMTGELADCFKNRRHGVTHIVDHVRRAVSDALPGTSLGFYSTAGSFVSAQEAEHHVDGLAASNWHALATWIGSCISPNGLLIDIGSTTTDIIPLQNGEVITSSKTDHQRLRDGSLVYVGCRRTPVCSLVDSLVFEGKRIPVMNELFATVDDARLILGTQAEAPDDCDSADGRPRDRESAHRRLAKMIGLDPNEMSHASASNAAKQVLHAARERITSSVTGWIERQQPLHEDFTLVLSGHGQELVADTFASLQNSSLPKLDLRKMIGSEASRAAPAVAVAKQWIALRCSIQ